MAQKNKTDLSTQVNAVQVNQAEAVTATIIRTLFADFLDSLFVTLTNTSDDVTEGTANLFLTAALRSKLEGIEAGATADQTGAEIATLLFALADTNNLNDSLLAKLQSIDATHYGQPLQDTTALAALNESAITDKERRYVEDELADYFYDATAVSGDIAPGDQTNGTGFWRKVAVGGETSVSIKTKLESNPDTNTVTDALLTKLTNLLTAAQLPAGGTSGQFLKKGAGGDYDADFDTIVINDIDQLQTSLDAKAAASHQHGSSDLTDLEFIYLQPGTDDDTVITAIGSATWTDNVATVTGFEQGRKYSDANYLYEAIADNTALRQKKAEAESTITVSTSDPSGGADGDIWFKVSA